MRYSKIQTLYNRDTDGNFGVIPGQFRCDEFALISKWLITEKIDGRNHRVMLFADGHVEHRGRTDRAQFAPFMMDAAQRLVDNNTLRTVIEQDVNGEWPMTILYGELYGPKIQSGGKYCDNIRLRLFDVRIGDWWLNYKDVVSISGKLNLGYAPVLAVEADWVPTCKAELLDLFPYNCSVINKRENVEPEGIVARTDPLLLNRRGERVMWKLKVSDFKGKGHNSR